MTSNESRDKASSVTQDHGFNLDRVRSLVAAMEQELANAPVDQPNVQALRQEIETLKQVLADGDDQHVLVKEKLHTVRGTLQDMTARVESEVLQDSRYIAEIGRILGLV